MIGLVSSKMFRQAIIALEEYSMELSIMAMNLEYIAPNSRVVEDLRHQKQIIDKIIAGFVGSKINTETEVKSILDAFYSMDDESALMTIDFHEIQKRYPQLTEDKIN